MDKRQYWLVVFTGKTWEEFLAAGGTSMGFRERRRRTVGRMQPGDLLLCYVSKVSRWIGVLEVTDTTSADDSPIFSDEAFPVRVRVKVVSSLDPEHSVPMQSILHRFSWWDEEQDRWGARFQAPPAEMKARDAQLVVSAIDAALRNPAVRPVAAKAWAATPTAYPEPVRSQRGSW